MQSIIAAQLAVWKPDDEHYPSATVPGADVIAYEHSLSAGDQAASGTVELDNHHGQYSRGDAEIEADDRLELWISRPEDGVGERFGADQFGAGPFGEGPRRRVGTTLVTGGSISGARHDSTLDLDLASFVLGRMSARRAFYSEEARPIAGSEDAHLDAILREFVPAVDRSQLPTIDATIDYAADGTPVDAVLGDLAQHARAETGTPWVPFAVGERLYLRDIDALDVAFDSPARLGKPGDFAAVGADFTAPNANEIRVEGGIDDTDNIDDEQTTIDSYETVTTTSRLTRRVDSRKSELTKIEVYTRHTGKEDIESKLRVRMQADDGTGNAPVAVGDADSDLQSGTAEQAPTDGGDWQPVRLGEYTLAPRGNPWLIIEATDDDGIEVAVDANGVPAYRVYFPKPVIVRNSDETSKDTYRLHEAVIEDDSLVTFTSALQRARAELARRSKRRVTLDGVALSDRAHALTVGDIVPFESPWLKANGEFIVTERSTTYNGSQLETAFRFEGYDSYA